MKRSIKMIALLLVLALMAGGTLLVQKLNETESVSETEGSFALTAHTAEDVTGLSWTNEGVTWHFVKKDGAWHNADDAAFPASTDAVQAMADELAAMTATRRLEDVTEPANYGLAEPGFTITAEWADGSSSTYAMGAELPIGDGYYLSISSEENVVYAVEDALDERFSKTGTELASLEAIPELEDPTRLVISGILDISRAEASTSIDPDQLWYTADGVAVSNTEAETKVTAANGILWNELLSTNASDEELAAWNLTEDTATAISLYTDDEPGLTVLIGAKDEDGNYYARLPESRLVYNVTSSEVNTLLTASVDDLRVTDLMPLDYERVQQAEITADDSAFTFSGVPAEEETTETTEESAETEEAPAPGQELWNLIHALTASSFTEETAQGDALLTIAVTNVNGVTETLSFHAYDVDSYLVSTATGECALTDAAAVDKIIRALRQLV